jgi:hypothetical protein
MLLRECFDAHRGRPLGKVDHFFDIYEQHFARFRDTEVRVLEIGVDQGGSLELWRNYFGASAQIHGIDINPLVLERVPECCSVHIGSQADAVFIESILSEYGPFDLVIDDGSHVMHHQIETFEMIYPHMSPTGVYVCEDAFTSYWCEYGGKLKKPGTFMEYAKGLIDELHAYWVMDESYEQTPFTKMTQAIHFYSGAVVFQRKQVEDPIYITREGNNLSKISITDLKSSAHRQFGSRL